jgi:hypothetical protein
MKQKINNDTPQQEGRNLEGRFSKTYGGDEVPGSGNGRFFKLDVRDSKFLWSLKWTSKKSFSIKREDLKEVEDEVYGPGGLGHEYVPGLATELEGEIYATIKMDDLVKLMEQDAKVFEPDKARAKREKAKVPALLRKED